MEVPPSSLRKTFSPLSPLLFKIPFMKAVPKPRRQRRGEFHCRGEGGGTHSSGRQFDRGERLRIEGGGKRGDDERIEDFIFFEE